MKFSLKEFQIDEINILISEYLLDNENDTSNPRYRRLSEIRNQLCIQQIKKELYKQRIVKLLNKLGINP